MPKINIKVIIKNPEETIATQTKAILRDNFLKYKEQETMVIFDYKENILIRENEKLKMKYHFKKNKGNIIIKENHINIEIPIKTLKIHRKSNDIKIEYKIDEETFLYQIEEEK